MCACRGETSGCKINHASSESKQGVEEGWGWGGGEKENQVDLSKAAAFEIHLGCGRALKRLLICFQDPGYGKRMCHDWGIEVGLR